MLGFTRLIATVVSFDWRFWASKLGLGVPPSTLLLSNVTLTSAPSVACVANAVGTATNPIRVTASNTIRRIFILGSFRRYNYSHSQSRTSLRITSLTLTAAYYTLSGGDL